MNILTAVNDEKVYYNIKNNLKGARKYNIFKNIVYKEGIIEYIGLKKEKIDFLVIDNKINGDIDLFDLIKQVLDIDKEVNIIILIDEIKSSDREFFKNYGIDKIIIKEDNQKDANRILYYITDDYKYIQNNLENEIEELRKIIFEKNKKSIFNKILGKIKKKKTNKIKETKNKEKEEQDKTKNKKELKKSEKIEKNNDDKNGKEGFKYINNKSKIYIKLSEEINKYNIEGIEIVLKKE